MSSAEISRIEVSALLILAGILAWIAAEWLESRGRPAETPVTVTALSGDVERPGVRVFRGDGVSVGDVLESAGVDGASLEALPEGFLERVLSDGQGLRLNEAPSGLRSVRLEPLGARARLLLGGKLDLNRASEEDLRWIPKMKEEWAAAIVGRRRERPWGRVEDLEEIHGIGPRTASAFRNFLEVGEGG